MRTTIRSTSLIPAAELSMAIRIKPLRRDMLRSRRGNAALAVTSAIRGEDNRLAILKRRSKQQQSVTNLAGSAGPNGVTNYQGWALPHQVAAKIRGETREETSAGSDAQRG